MQNNPWFAATMGLSGLIVGYVIANSMNGFALMQNLPSQANNPPVAGDALAPPTPSNETPADVDDDPSLGDDNATVTVIEFTDYQCPFCSRHFTQTFSQIKQEYIDTGKIKYVTRDFPLGFHPHAQKAAEASECADDQGKFWEMHDKLFQDQGTWSALPDAIPTFKQYAAGLGLNASDFDACLDNGDKASEVQADLTAGSNAGISGTPGFWVVGPDGTGQKIEGAYPFDSFKAAIDSML